MIEGEDIKQEIMKKEIKSIACDGCDKKETYDPRKGIWNDYDGDHERTQVNANLIIGGRYIKYDFDVCPVCFQQKIIPLFDGKGTENRIERIRDKIKRMFDDARREQERAEEWAKSADRMPKQAEHLEHAARCLGKQMALTDILNMIRDLT